MAVNKWIAGAIGKPGALHDALGIPADEKIPSDKLAKATNSPDLKLRREAILAQTLRRFHK
jgi:hypothetical protein